MSKYRGGGGVAFSFVSVMVVEARTTNFWVSYEVNSRSKINETKEKVFETNNAWYISFGSNSQLDHTIVQRRANPRPVRVEGQPFHPCALRLEFREHRGGPFGVAKTVKIPLFISFFCLFLRANQAAT